MTGATIIRDTIGEQVFSELRGWIVAGRLKPGQRVRPDEIATELNVSQTPVKAAMLRLDAEGLVESVPRRGTVVRRLSTSHTKNLFEVREMIETWAVSEGFAAERITPEFLLKIRATIDDLCKAIVDGQFADAAGAMEADRQMHYLLVGLGGNSMMMDWYRQVISQTEFIRIYATEPERAPETEAEHERIYAALKSRDLPQVLQAIRDHFGSAYRSLLLTINDNEQQWD